VPSRDAGVNRGARGEETSTHEYTEWGKQVEEEGERETRVDVKRAHVKSHDRFPYK
jgi:hypothetical protein